ncbi:transposase [Nostoc sp. CHAB 5834]|nr:transposase [Nostoc sp. CHAB 5834]
MKNPFCLPGWSVLEVRPGSAPELQLTVVYLKQPKACLGCGVENQLQRTTWRYLKLQDQPISGVPVKLRARLSRFLCKECGFEFSQPVTGIDQKLKMTERCVQYIGTASLSTPYYEIASAVNRSFDIVREISEAYWSKELDASLQYLPTNMGIHTVKLGRNDCILITDLANRVLVDLLPSKESSALEKWFSKRKPGAPTVCFISSKDSKMLTFVRTQFPSATCVVDRNFVLNEFQHVLEKSKKAIKKLTPPIVLQRYKKAFHSEGGDASQGQEGSHAALPPELGEMEAKWLESFFELSRNEAERALVEYLEQLEARTYDRLPLLVEFLKTWRAQMLDSLDFDLSYGRQEALDDLRYFLTPGGGVASLVALRCRIRLGPDFSACDPLESIN